MEIKLIIINIVFIAISTIIILVFINEKSKKINYKMDVILEKLNKKRPRGKIEVEVKKESN